MMLGIGAAVLVSHPEAAQARLYSHAIDIIDYEELNQLLADGLIDESEQVVLAGLLESPLWLNTVERDDLYLLPNVTWAQVEALVDERTENGPYDSLEDLAARVEEIDEDTALTLEPFTVVWKRGVGAAKDVRAHVDFLVNKHLEGYQELDDDYPARSHSVEQLGYGAWPAFYLGGGAVVKKWLSFGLAGVAQEQVKFAQYEPSSERIHAAWGQPTFRPLAGFVAMDKEDIGQVRVGSYHAAFGQGLVLNTIGGRNRHGLYSRSSVQVSDSDRIKPFDGLLGAAGRLTAVKLGRTTLDISAFGSIRRYDIYQYYLGLTGGGTVGLLQDSLASPEVWIQGRKARYITIPNALQVGLVGGNVTLQINRRSRIGFTGYFAHQDRDVLPGVEDPDTLVVRQRWPGPANFGTLGVMGALGVGLIDVEGEWALYSDRDGPGMAGLILARLEPMWGEAEFSFRHYDVKYANPFGKGMANADKVGGLSARNETGFRARVAVDPLPQLRATVTADLARNIMHNVWDGYLRGNVRVTPLDFLQVDLLGSANNHALGIDGPDRDYGGDLDLDLSDVRYLDGSEPDVDGDLDARTGEKYSLGGGVKVMGKRVGSIELRYKHTWEGRGKTLLVADQSRCDAAFQNGHNIRVRGRLTPGRTTTVSGSFLYVDEDLHGDRGFGSPYGPRGVYGQLQLVQKIARLVTLKVRGGLGTYLADEPSACDKGSWVDSVRVPDLDYTYEPDDWETRPHGNLMVKVTVRF